MDYRRPVVHVEPERIAGSPPIVFTNLVHALMRYYQIQNPTIGTMWAAWLSATSLNAPAAASAWSS